MQRAFKSPPTQLTVNQAAGIAVNAAAAAAAVQPAKAVVLHIKPTQFSFGCSKQKHNGISWTVRTGHTVEQCCCLLTVLTEVTP
jgi:hypothetical protein